MIALARFLLWQETKLNSELPLIAGCYSPLDRCLVDLNESGLSRRIAFERWFGALSSNVDRSAAITEAIVAREIDTIVVKGKTETTRIFELLGLAGEMSTDTLTLRERTAAALATYRVQEWAAAERLFRKCLAIEPADHPARLFLERIAVFRVSPPALDWKGAWVFAVK